MELPTISVVMPTLNSQRTLEQALDSIIMQDYPQEKVEIIICDASSSDNTIEIAKTYTNRIYFNPLRTGEAGKAIGVKHASGDIIALIDSDNLLPEKNWFRRMVEPFNDPEIVGSEPLSYTYRKNDGYITRYCSLIGMNDPLCLFLGNYDRFCTLSGKWTETKVIQSDKGSYIKVHLNEKQIPTMGANGFLIRKEQLKQCSVSDYLFDIDVIYELTTQGYLHYAKVKIGIVHIFSGNISTFIRKQRRRINDYEYYNTLNFRKYPWIKTNKKGIFKFFVFSVLVVPLLLQSIIGYSKKKDSAWLFHIPACWLTLLIYGYGSIRNYVIGKKLEDRTKW